jgi:hypothetical protein
LGYFTGVCGVGTGIEYGLIRINTEYSSIYASNSNIKNYIIRHEFAHVLGLGHDSSCNPSTSIMSVSPTICSPAHTTLQTPEKNLINAWYP